MAKILIADDSPTERQMFFNALKELGHECLLAEDGEETERIFFEFRPDIVILDVVMPKKDGYQVCRNIKGHEELGEVPIIMVSARDSDSDRYWGLKQGADEYLKKPFEMSLLLNKVREHLL